MPQHLFTNQIEKHGRIQEELEKASEKYHILGAWIAVIFDPLFAITDYINIPHGWKQLLAIRLSISLITLVFIFLRKKDYLRSNVLVIFIPFMLISLQNAYTFSLINNEGLLGHCLNYIALLIGGGMFLLWDWRYSILTIILSALATAFFVSLNPEIDPGKFFLNGGLLLIAVAAFMFILIRTRYNSTIREIKARLLIEEINQELVIQKELVDNRNHQITSSIRYAQRIQNAILGAETALSRYFKNSFVLFKPKDILSGDFYWFYENKEDDVKVIVAADCTGHGVPGALTTVLGCALLNDIIVQKNIYAPGRILEELDKAVTKSFSTEKDAEKNISDGMDISILTFQDEKTYFAAAKNPLYIMRDGEVEIVKGSRSSIGSSKIKKEKIFTTHELNLQPGNKLYIFSDGYQDQIGEKKNKKYYTKRFREYLTETSSYAIPEQLKLLKDDFENWQGNLPQTDDVLVVGIEV